MGNSLKHLATVIRMTEDSLIRDYKNGVINKNIEAQRQTLYNLRKEYQFKLMRALV